MAAGKFNMQAADGAVIGLVVPDGLTSGERQISLGVNLSGIAAYHLLQGNLAVSASTITQGFNTTLYTSGSATTSIDMDTQWGNTAEEKFGGLVWLKDRVEATNHFLYDTVRGATKEINSNTIEAEATLAGGLTAFNSTGFTVGADAGHNSTTNNMASWNFQTTHRVTGTTNHGKAYTCHFNPFTGFTIVKYEGSGIAGHEIPHMLGRKLNFQVIKNLSAAHDWVAGASILGGGYLLLNTTVAFQAQTNLWYPPSGYTDTSIILSVNNIADNTSTNQYIMYGWTNSYLDESNKLIGNYELVPYQGTGVAGNKVKTKGKPAWVMIKRTDVAGESWAIYDNQRTPSRYLIANATDIDQSAQALGTFDSNGFTINNTVWGSLNTAGGQYIALVAYDTNSNGGGSYYPLASDTANVQINNALIPLAQGIDSNGAKNTILSKNETITGLTYTQGKNYVYCDKNGSYGVTSHKPRYLESELVRTYASEAPDYYDVVKNKWFSTSGQGELVSNGTFDVNTSGWVDSTATSTIIWENGRMKVTRTGGIGGHPLQTISGLTIGRKYKFIATINPLNNGCGIRITDGSTTLAQALNSANITEYVNITIIPISTEIKINAILDTIGQVVYLDNISVFATDIVPTTEITNSRNYLNHIVHADNDGGVLYVEELPKIEYKDIVKANEFKGKNACTMWAILDCTTTPITIKDSYNVAYVTRLGTGDIEIMPLDLDLSKVTVIPGGHASENPSYTGLAFGAGVYNGKIRVNSRYYNNSAINLPELSINVYGGKN